MQVLTYRGSSSPRGLVRCRWYSPPGHTLIIRPAIQRYGRVTMIQWYGLVTVRYSLVTVRSNTDLFLGELAVSVGVWEGVGRVLGQGGGQVPHRFYNKGCQDIFIWMSCKWNIVMKQISWYWKPITWIKKERNYRNWHFYAWWLILTQCLHN